jgi:NADP-dependent 3-hydroxy acid dehydrogenase YdfG
MIETTLLGAITTTEVFLDQLRAGEGGDLINISSIAGRRSRGAADQRRLRRDEVRAQRLVGVLAPGAAARRPRDGGRARGRRHRADRPHHPRGDKEATEQFVKDTAIRPEDIADVIAFAVSRPRRMTLNEILVRPTAQQG